MIDASCHCGAVRFSVENPPAKLNDCNCSICRRYGTLWGYYERPQVRFSEKNGPTDVYMWGDRELEFHRCHSCGCVTHWIATDPVHLRMGVNARLMPLELFTAIPVVHTDGASM